MRAPSLIEVCAAEDGRARARALARSNSAIRRGLDPARAEWAPLPWEGDQLRYAAGGIAIGIPTLDIGSGGAPVWSPLSLGSALVLWLRADATSITLNGSTVSAWADRSASGWNATQATAANQPTYRADGHARCINGRAVIDCDGSASPGDFLSLPDMSSLTAAEVFIVGRANADPTVVANGQGGLYKFGSDALDPVVPFTDGVVYDEFGTTARKTTGNPSASLASAFIYNVTSVSGEWTSRVNGTQHFTTAANTVGFTASPRIGAAANAATRWDGVIGEVFMANRKLTAAERARAVAYLRSLWGNIS